MKKFIFILLCLSLTTSGFGLQKINVVATSVPESMDPTRGWHYVHFTLMRGFSRALVRLLSGGRIEADLARRWTIGNKNTLYTFYLDPNARFQDGTPVTSKIAAISFARHFWPGSASMIQPYLRDKIKGASRVSRGQIPEGIKSPSDWVLQIELEEPYPPFLKFLGFSGFSVVKEGGKDWNEVIGCGQMSAEFDKGTKSWTMRSIGKPAGQEIVIRQATTAEAKALIQNNGVDLLLGYSDPEVDLNALPPSYRPMRFETHGILHFYFNCEVPELASTAYRQALSELIQSAVRKTRAPGYFVEAIDAYMPAGMMPFSYYSPRTHGEVDHVLLKKRNLRRPLRIFIREEYLNPEILINVRRTLQEAGVRAEVSSAPIKDMMLRLEKGDYDLVMPGYFGVVPDPAGFMGMFALNTKHRYGRCLKPAELESLDAAGEIQGEKQRLQRYSEILSQLEKEAYWVPLFHLYFPAIAHSSIDVPSSKYIYFSIADLKKGGEGK